ncbi:poly-gamma-glutamate hydrolase family protein [Streptomyces sp. R41]|uniref:Poly-gamma-glutamate hydrolase family protein n=1 Tax=Streptomyces sp. R41 TaxID=3238632 RepID=A0AB39RY04_9ACTN
MLVLPFGALSLLYVAPGSEQSQSGVVESDGTTATAALGGVLPHVVVGVGDELPGDVGDAFGHVEARVQRRRKGDGSRRARQRVLVLDQRVAGARRLTVADAAPERAGDNPRSICNRNLSGRGVQLELSTAQRAAFFKDGDMGMANRSNRSEEFNRYVAAVQTAYRRLRA